MDLKKKKKHFSTLFFQVLFLEQWSSLSKFQFQQVWGRAQDYRRPVRNNRCLDDGDAAGPEAMLAAPLAMLAAPLF